MLFVHNEWNTWSYLIFYVYYPSSHFIAENIYNLLVCVDVCGDQISDTIDTKSNIPLFIAQLSITPS
jgi:hypothetical protein